MDLLNPNAKGLRSLLPTVRNPNPVFVLTMDGGGIRSLLPLYALRFLEDELGLPISNIFDVIAATSTSSLVAAGLAVPNTDRHGNEPFYSADNLMQVMTSSMPEIFKPQTPVDPYVTRPRYTSETLLDFLEVFYPGKLGSSLTNLVLPTYDRISEEPFVFASWKEARPPLDFKDVLRATVASPNYYPEVKMTVNDRNLRLVEGGLHSYNPTEVAIGQTMEHFPWQPIVTLSLGSGIMESKKANTFISRTPKSPVWGSPYQDQKIRCESELIDKAYRDNFDNYTRAQVELTNVEDALLGDFHEATEFFPSTLSVLEYVGNRYVEQNKANLSRFCNFFKGQLKIQENTSWGDWNLTEDDIVIRDIAKMESPLDQIEPDDTAELARAKSDLLACLKEEVVKKSRKKYSCNLLNGHPYYKEIKLWTKKLCTLKNADELTVYENWWKLNLKQISDREKESIRIP